MALELYEVFLKKKSKIRFGSFNKIRKKILDVVNFETY
jgi:hypothetical protein